MEPFSCNSFVVDSIVLSVEANETQVCTDVARTLRSQSLHLRRDGGGSYDLDAES